MAAKYPQEVQQTIREAVAAGERHSVAYRKLTAGTLPGLDGPVAMPARSFTYQWTRAKREQGRGRAYSGPTVFEALVVEVACKEMGSDDPERLADATGYSLELVREVLTLMAEAKARADGHTRACDLVAERRRAAEGI
jgi:hypothetical protein